MEGKREEVLEILRSMDGTVRGQAGCEDCDIYEQSGGESAILYLGQWRSSEDLARHIQSSLFLRVLLAIDFAARAPEIHFHEISGTKVLPWIETLRTSDDLVR